MKELTMAARREIIPQIDFVNEELDRLGCSVKTKAQINIAIDELYGNIAQYAYDGEDGQVTVQIDTETDPHSVSLSFQDAGKPFTPLETGNPDITLPARERKISGLGIYMVKKSMEEVRYEYPGWAEYPDHTENTVGV